MFGLGVGELTLVLVIVVLLFGGSRLPGLGRSIGLGISNFRKAVDGKDVLGGGRDSEKLQESD